jgi:hypothetical protein
MIDWLDGRPCNDCRLLMALPWQVGDRVYLQEEWTWVEGYTHPDHDEWIQELPISRSRFFGAYEGDEDDDAIAEGWQPAERMPPEAAQHWYTVTGVRVMQMHLRQLSWRDLTKAGIYTRDPDKVVETVDAIMQRTVGRWNAAHPEYLFHSGRWVIVLDVEAIAP